MAGALLISLVWGLKRGSRQPLFLLASLFLGTLLAYALYPLGAGLLAEGAGIPVLPACVTSASGLLVGVTLGSLALLRRLSRPPVVHVVPAAPAPAAEQPRSAAEDEETWWEATRSRIVARLPTERPTTAPQRIAGGTCALLVGVWLLALVGWVATLVDPSLPAAAGVADVSSATPTPARESQARRLFQDEVLPRLDAAPHFALARRVALMAKAARELKRAGPAAVQAAARQPTIRAFFTQPVVADALADPELIELVRTGKLGPALYHPRLAELLRDDAARQALILAPIEALLQEAVAALSAAPAPGPAPPSPEREVEAKLLAALAKETAARQAAEQAKREAERAAARAKAEADAKQLKLLERAQEKLKQAAAELARSKQNVEAARAAAEKERKRDRKAFLAALAAERKAWEQRRKQQEAKFQTALKDKRDAEAEAARAKQRAEAAAREAAKHKADAEARAKAAAAKREAERKAADAAKARADAERARLQAEKAKRHADAAREEEERGQREPKAAPTPAPTRAAPTPTPSPTPAPTPSPDAAQPPTPVTVEALYAASNRYSLRPRTVLVSGTRFAFRARVRWSQDANQAKVRWRLLDARGRAAPRFTRELEVSGRAGERTVFVEGTAPDGLPPGRYTLEVALSAAQRAPVTRRTPLEVRQAPVALAGLRLSRSVGGPPATSFAPGGALHLRATVAVRAAAAKLGRRFAWQVIDARGRRVPGLDGAQRSPAEGAGTFRFPRALNLPRDLAPGAYTLLFVAEVGTERAEAQAGFEVRE